MMHVSIKFFFLLNCPSSANGKRNKNVIVFGMRIKLRWMTVQPKVGLLGSRKSMLSFFPIDFFLDMLNGHELHSLE